VEVDDVGVVHALEHLELVVDHLLVSADVLLEDDLDGVSLAILLGLSYDSVRASAQRLAKAIGVPERQSAGVCGRWWPSGPYFLS
jgi:hypothetical protein